MGREGDVRREELPSHTPPNHVGTSSSCSLLLPLCSKVVCSYKLCLSSPLPFFKAGSPKIQPKNDEKTPRKKNLPSTNNNPHTKGTKRKRGGTSKQPPTLLPFLLLGEPGLFGGKAPKLPFVGDKSERVVQPTGRAGRHLTDLIDFVPGYLAPVSSSPANDAFFVDHVQCRPSLGRHISSCRSIKQGLFSFSSLDGGIAAGRHTDT